MSSPRVVSDILVAPRRATWLRAASAPSIGAFVPADHRLGTALGLHISSCCSASISRARARALVVAALFKRTLIKGDALPFAKELPSYRWPTFGSGRARSARAPGPSCGARERSSCSPPCSSKECCSGFPRVEPPAQLDAEAAAAYQLERSSRAGSATPSSPRFFGPPRPFEWKIGVGLVASLRAGDPISLGNAPIYATEMSDRRRAGIWREALFADLLLTARRSSTP